MVSADKDLMQPRQRRGRDVRHDAESKNRAQAGRREVRGRPERVTDVQALAGDSTDNIPGAPGIGIKTAAQLINQYGDLESLLAAAGEIPQPKRRQALTENTETIRISKQLVELNRSVPLNLGLEDLAIAEPDPAVLLEFLREQEFRTLTGRVEKYFSIEPPPKKPDESHKGIPFDHENYECVKADDALGDWIEAIRHRGYVAVDTETTGLDEMQSGLVGISLAVEPGKACYIPLTHVSGAQNLLNESPKIEGQLQLESVLSRLKPVLEDEGILKIGQNIKFDAKSSPDTGSVSRPWTTPCSWPLRSLREACKPVNGHPFQQVPGSQAH